MSKVQFSCCFFLCLYFRGFVLFINHLCMSCISEMTFFLEVCHVCMDSYIQPRQGGVGLFRFYQEIASTYNFFYLSVCYSYFRHQSI